MGQSCTDGKQKQTADRDGGDDYHSTMVMGGATSRSLAMTQRNGGGHPNRHQDVAGLNRTRELSPAHYQTLKEFGDAVHAQQQLSLQATITNLNQQQQRRMQQQQQQPADLKKLNSFSQKKSGPDHTPPYHTSRTLPHVSTSRSSTPTGTGGGTGVHFQRQSAQNRTLSPSGGAGPHRQQQQQHNGHSTHILGRNAPGNSKQPPQQQGRKPGVVNGNGRPPLGAPRHGATSNNTSAPTSPMKAPEHSSRGLTLASSFGSMSTTLTLEEQKITESAILLRSHSLQLEEGNERRVLETEQRRALRRMYEQLEDIENQEHFVQEMRSMWRAVRDASRSPARSGEPIPPTSPVVDKQQQASTRSPSSAISDVPLTPGSHERPKPPKNRPRPTSSALEGLAGDEESSPHRPSTPLEVQQERARGEKLHSKEEEEKRARESVVRAESVSRNRIVTSIVPDTTASEAAIAKARITQQKEWLEESQTKYRTPRRAAPTLPADNEPFSSRDANGNSTSSSSSARRLPSHPPPRLPADADAANGTSSTTPRSTAHHGASYADPTTPPPSHNMSSRALRDESLSATHKRLMALSR